MPDFLQPHVKPPEATKAVYKVFQKLDANAIYTHPQIIDTHVLPGSDHPRLKEAAVGAIKSDSSHPPNDLPASPLFSSVSTAFEVTSIPGLSIYPSLVPPEFQISLLDKLLHRDLRNPEHNTNVHLHYHIPYPQHQSHNGRSTPSFFDGESLNLQFTPKDPTLHKSISTHQFLSKKLRWMTLGGQYDWTLKTYPGETPPSFPPDIASSISTYFPTMKPEAAIANLYSPGDTLSLHRDTSEECDKPLVSVSFGCDGLFVVGIESTSEHTQSATEVIRLRSGDAVLMSGRSRYAWHGVPKVLESTCPEWLEAWPGGADGGGGGGQFPEWKGWMKGKRINLNVRQMFD